MTLTAEQWLYLQIYAGVATPLVITGVATWFVLWRITWREGSSDGPTLDPREK
jgi:hypothetical protein